MRLADVTPLNPWTTRAVRIDEVTREMDGVSTYQLRFIVPSSADEYHFSPGQFNMLYLPGVGESAVSMSGNPNGNDSWIHTVRVAGNVTRTLAGLDIGDTLGLRGPFGKGWPVSELKGCDVVIVAGGLGMAPLRPLIYELMARREEVGKIWLICGARSAEGLLYSKEWENWRRKGIDVQLTVDIPNTLWEGHIGVVTVRPP
ncbi:MAG: hypothetical protein FJ267_13870 [Planctomycetes bacterium]|nr:hypothetical protein [Planctomycetota bacterium]